jgi:hypothetical protein
MTLLSASHHVNLANACHRLNDKNRISTTFFRRHFSRRLASVGGCREPSGTPTIESLSGSARRTYGQATLRGGMADQNSGAAVVSRLCHGNHRYGVGSTVVRVWASENISV